MYYFMHKGQDALHSRRRQVLRPERRAPPLADRHAALLTRQAHRKGAQAPGVGRGQAPHHLAGLGDRAGQGGGQDAAQAGDGVCGDERPLGLGQGQAAGNEGGERLLGDGGFRPAQVLQHCLSRSGCYQQGCRPNAGWGERLQERPMQRGPAFIVLGLNFRTRCQQRLHCCCGCFSTVVGSCVMQRLTSLITFGSHIRSSCHQRLHCR